MQKEFFHCRLKLLERVYWCSKRIRNSTIRFQEGFVFRTGLLWEEIFYPRIDANGHLWDHATAHDRHVQLGRVRFDGGDGLLDQWRNGMLLHVEWHHAGRHLLEIENVVDECRQPIAIRFRHVE